MCMDHKVDLHSIYQSHTEGATLYLNAMNYMTFDICSEIFPLVSLLIREMRISLMGLKVFCDEALIPWER